MQLARSWRVFSRNPGAAFRVIGDVDEALAVLDTTDAQQQERMQQLGLPFNLNDETCSKFYRDLVRRGLAEGYVIASALTCGREIVATVLGIRQGNGFVFLRISNAGKQWSPCSPSRLIIERTMAALHRDGVRNFDLSIGNYAFKRRFGAAPLPLTDVEHRARLARNSLCVARSRRAAIAAFSVARRTGRPSARQADCFRRGLDLPHHARPAQRAFQRIAIPLRGIGRGLIGALQEIEQRLVRLRGQAHGIVRQDEFA